MSSSTPDQQDSTKFERSPVPQNDGKPVRSVGCCIIGDEVLNGKTKDSNSNFLAKACFDLGIEVKRIEVIPDDEDDIVATVKRMARDYDLVITSGGIGPTHDDITYQSIAKAFDAQLEYHEETKKRMVALSKRASLVVRATMQRMTEQTEEQKKARNRMALFPTGAEVLYVQQDLWVPVVRVAGKVCILPGVPSLFERLLTGLMSRYVTLPPSSEKPFRFLVHTSQPESSIAPFLTSLQGRVKDEGIRVGSYPKLFAGVDVSLIGKDEQRLKALSDEVVKELQGEVVAQGKLGEEK
ncbi:hypothetical protein OIO90_005020 [Microbotryomycetes sp. JL221]|nr:hypothetical protein OIO90_005020 [Microbotryomycetes sp. JL221]